jgi:hypothetical protein
LPLPKASHAIEIGRNVWLEKKPTPPMAFIGLFSLKEKEPTGLEL